MSRIGGNAPTCEKTRRLRTARGVSREAHLSLRARRRPHPRKGAGGRLRTSTTGATPYAQLAVRALDARWQPACLRLSANGRITVGAPRSSRGVYVGISLGARPLPLHQRSGGWYL